MCFLYGWLAQNGLVFTPGCFAYHCEIAAFCWYPPTHRSCSCLPGCDRKVPMVFYATDEPIFFLRFVLIACCAHMLHT